LSPVASASARNFAISHQVGLILANWKPNMELAED